MRTVMYYTFINLLQMVAILLALYLCVGFRAGPDSVCGARVFLDTDKPDFVW